MFLNVDYNIYGELLHHYFPPEGSGAGGKKKEGERVEEEREERSTGETDGVGSPSTPVADDKEPTTAAAATGEERETEIDVPILRKSITEPGIYILYVSQNYARSIELYVPLVAYWYIYMLYTYMYKIAQLHVLPSSVTVYLLPSCINSSENSTHQARN